MELSKLTALVTGGTKGIGAATAVALAERGARVAIVGRSLDAGARETQSRIKALGGGGLFLAADVARPDEARRCVREAAEKLGPPAVLVHCAGGPVSGGLLDLDAGAWQAAFDLHVHAIFHLCQEAVPLMRQRQQGAIVLVSSAAGLRGVATNVAYQVVKGALPQFARALAREFANDNIRVNCVAPGIIRTAFHVRMSAAAQQHNIEHRIPLHREGAPEQVARLIVELVENDYLTGETVAIDGGLSMRIA